MNALNRTQYAIATNTPVPSNTQFGQVTGQTNGPRVIQFNLRLDF